MSLRLSLILSMKIVDLSVPLTHRMPVYQGDPEVDIVEVHTLEKEGWNLRQITITTHLGTHVNVPYHMVKDGKKLDKFSIDAFMGEAIIYAKDKNWDPDIGLIFRDQNIDQKIVDKLLYKPPKFVGLSTEFEFDVELEKLLLVHGIISFENLANTGQLPDSFKFYGVPLNIAGADGSPVRAYASFG